MNWRACFNPENEKELVKEFIIAYGVPTKIYSAETGICSETHDIMAFIYIYDFAVKTYITFLYNKMNEQVLSTFVNVMGRQLNPGAFHEKIMKNIDESINEIIKNIRFLNKTIIISKIKRIV